MSHTTKQPWDDKKLRRAFNYSNTITYNYGQSDQDIWVLSMLNGLHNGTYLEIGAGWPEHISNTALLELLFDDVLIEIKVTSYEICSMRYLSQVFTYGYLMTKKDKKMS